MTPELVTKIIVCAFLALLSICLFIFGIWIAIRMLSEKRTKEDRIAGCFGVVASFVCSVAFSLILFGVAIGKFDMSTEKEAQAQQILIEEGVAPERAEDVLNEILEITK